MDERYEIMEAYLGKQLSEADRLAFEERLRTDRMLSRDFAEYRQMWDSMKAQMIYEVQDQALKQTLQQLGREHFKEEATPATITPPKSSYLRWVLVLAITAVIALLIWKFLVPGPANLYQQYRNFPVAAFIEKGAPQEKDLQNAENLFNNKQYAQAAPLLNTIAAQDNNNLQIRFYAALCHIETGDYQQAETQLKALAGSNSVWKEEAEWYLALSYLKAGNKQACLDLLQNFSPAHAHARDAQSLRSKLR